MSATALGIDFYSGNSFVWEQASMHPPDFVIVGATTGLQSYYDKYGGRPFALDWGEADRRQIAKSAYHFYIEGIDPVQQALKFLSVIRATNSRESFPLPLDLETTSSMPILKATGIRAWLEEVFLRTGKRPMIYTSEEMWKDVVGDVSWAVDYEIWLAGYPTRELGWHEPDLSYKVAIPEPWKSAGKSWTFWQYGSGGRDLDTFKSSLADFNAYCEAYKGGASAPPDNGGNLTEKIMVTTDRLNVRAQPTTGSAILFALSAGTKIVVDPNMVVLANGYHWVKWLSGQGYVAQEFLKENPLA